MRLKLKATTAIIGTLSGLALGISVLSQVSTPIYAQQGITPCAAPTALSVTATSSNVQLSACGTTVLLWNVTSQEAFFTYGTASNTAATTSSYSLPGNAFIVLNVDTNKPYLAAITASSTTTIRIIQGYTR